MAWVRQHRMFGALHRDLDRAHKEFEQLRKCNRVPRGRIETVTIERRDGRYSVDDMCKCKRKLACPKCALSWSMASSVKISAGLYYWRKAGTSDRGEIMVTLTFPHRHMRYKQSVEIVQKAKSAFFKKNTVRKFLKTHRAEKVTAFDSTWSEVHGLHPHYHSLWAMEGVHVFDGQSSTVPWREACEHDAALAKEIDARLIEAAKIQNPRRYWTIKKDILEEQRQRSLRRQYCESLQKVLFPVWQECIFAEFEKHGIELSESQKNAFRDYGLRVDPHDAGGEYLSKWGLAQEVTGGPRKSKHPLSLLDKAKTHPAYREYVRAVVGVQALTGLSGLLERSNVTEEQIEQHGETLAKWKAEAEGVCETLPDLELHITAETWQLILETGTAKVWWKLDRVRDAQAYLNGFSEVEAAKLAAEFERCVYLDSS